MTDYFEMLDNVSAAAENMLAQFGPQMTSADRASRSKLISEARRLCDAKLRPEDELDEPLDRCTNSSGHKFECTGTAYGGDDPRWFGEGRCLCIYCGADGDG